MSNRTDEFAEILACVLNYVAEHPDCAVIIGGDFNCEFTASERTLWPLLCEFMSECDLTYTDHLITDDKCYIYYQPTTGATSHIDHFIVSRSLLECVESVSVIDDGCNLSDHLPVTIVCNQSKYVTKVITECSMQFLLVRIQHKLSSVTLGQSRPNFLL